ncbi:MAG: hypothetical protein RIA69_11375 [Cyclobacteriaceae bacterium]
MKYNSKDFVPEKTKGGMFKSSKVQKFETVREEMNKWLGENPEIEVLNIETLVLPNIHDKDEEGSQDTELITWGETSSQWYQLIRVWFRQAN